MFKSRFWFPLLIVSLFVFSACTTLQVSDSDLSQPCPEWTRISEGNCTIKLEKYSISTDYSRGFDLDKYQILQIITTNSSLIVELGENISVKDEAGEILAHTDIILKPGTYYIQVIEDGPADTSFQLKNVGEELLYYLATYATPVEPE